MLFCLAFVWILQHERARRRPRSCGVLIFGLRKVPSLCSGGARVSGVLSLKRSSLGSPFEAAAFQFQPVLLPVLARSPPSTSSPLQSHTPLGSSAPPSSPTASQSLPKSSPSSSSAPPPGHAANSASFSAPPSSYSPPSPPYPSFYLPAFPSNISALPPAPLPSLSQDQSLFPHQNLN